MPFVIAKVSPEGDEEFLAVGADRREAKAALLTAWRLHCQQDPYANPASLILDEVMYMEGSPGDVFRDGSLFCGL